MILITGASGFIGHTLCQDLLEAGFNVRAAIRERSENVYFPASIEKFVVGEVTPEYDWRVVLRDVTCIVHLISGMASQDKANLSLLNRYRKVNVSGIESLATMALSCGVQRLLYMSTIKVNGELTAMGGAFTENDLPQPRSAYAQSKWEAEQLLRKICDIRGPALTILRPPLVYGPRCIGNFKMLMRLIDLGCPLPFASIQNKRSLIYVKNLTSAVIACLNAPQAAGKTYLVSDGMDISTPDWIRAIARASAKPARLFPISPGLLNFAGALSGQAEITRRLTTSLQVDSSRIRDDLGWYPPFTLEEGFNATVQWYHSQDHT